MPKAKVTKVFSAKTRKLLSDAARRRWARERKLKAAAPVSVSTPPPPNLSILILRNDLVFETMRLHLRLEQFNADLVGVLGKVFFTNPDDPTLGGPAQQRILDNDQVLGGELMKCGEPASVLVDVDRPGVLFEGVPVRVSPSNCNGDYYRKASTTPPNDTGNIRFLGTQWSTHLSGL